MKWATAAVLLGCWFAGDPLACEPSCEQAFVDQSLDRGKVLMTARPPEDNYTPAVHGGFTPAVKASLGRWRATFRLHLQINSVGPAQYRECHTTLVLADGQRVAIGVAKYEALFVGGDTMAEMISVPLDEQAMMQLGSASRVELKICASEVKAREDFVCALHELACKVREWRSGGRDFGRCEPKPRPGPPPPPPL